VPVRVKCSVGVVLCDVRFGETRVGARTRRRLDRLEQRLDGAVGIVVGQLHLAHLEQGDCVFRFDCEHLPVLHQRSTVSLQEEQRVGVIEQRANIVRISGKCFLIVC
jgi:hypothetical protein